LKWDGVSTLTPIQSGGSRVRASSNIYDRMAGSHVLFMRRGRSAEALDKVGAMER
jgi:hypothetical protein